MTGPHIPPGALPFTHHPRTRPPLDVNEATSLRVRPPTMRTDVADIPRPGDLCGFRAREHGPVVLATVVRWVDSLEDPWATGEPDPNVWQVATDDRRQALRDELGRYRYVLHPDPWPQIILRVDPPEGSKGPRGFTSTRESRDPGSAGWLPRTAVDLKVR